jgi:hypothetical protein
MLIDGLFVNGIGFVFVESRWVMCFFNEIMKIFKGSSYAMHFIFLGFLIGFIVNFFGS